MILKAAYQHYFYKTLRNIPCDLSKKHKVSKINDWVPYYNETNKQTKSMVWVCERTILTERPPLVSKVIANLCG
jgi:hypothetical protein